MKVSFERTLPDAVLPFYAHGSHEDAGMDLCAIMGSLIRAHGTCMVGTGLKMALPTGVMGEIRSRSGLATRGIVVANSPGTIDPSYRGDLTIILHNNGSSDYYVRKGDKIAQLVITPYIQCEIVEGKVADFPSVRGERGFGSTDNSGKRLPPG